MIAKKHISIFVLHCNEHGITDPVERGDIMSIATTLQQYLEKHGIAYEIIPHRHTNTSMDASATAHVPAAKVAKPVILEDDRGYLMAVIPAHHHVKISRINRVTGRKMGLATEEELKSLFADCELGAIPPVGQAYGMETIVDNCLGECSDIYLEAGDHEDFVHIDAAAFNKLMSSVTHAKISI